MGLIDFIKRNIPDYNWIEFNNTLEAPIENIITHLACIYYLKDRYSITCLYHWIIELKPWFKTILNATFNPHKNKVDKLLKDYTKVINEFSNIRIKSSIIDKYAEEFKNEGIKKYNTEAKNLSNKVTHNFKKDLVDILSHLITNRDYSVIILYILKVLQSEFNYNTSELEEMFKDNDLI